MPTRKLTNSLKSSLIARNWTTQARIELDLDDGVKVNYIKLGEALAPIAGLAAKENE